MFKQNPEDLREGEKVVYTGNLGGIFAEYEGRIIALPGNNIFYCDMPITLSQNEIYVDFHQLGKEVVEAHKIQSTNGLEAPQGPQRATLWEPSRKKWEQLEQERKRVEERLSEDLGDDDLR